MKLLQQLAIEELRCQRILQPHRRLCLSLLEEGEDHTDLVVCKGCGSQYKIHLLCDDDTYGYWEFKFGFTLVKEHS